MAEPARVVSASRQIAAPAAAIFELIADPAGSQRVQALEGLLVSARGEVVVRQRP
jgi:hypothetical protein